MDIPRENLSMGPGSFQIWSHSGDAPPNFNPWNISWKWTIKGEWLPSGAGVALLQSVLQKGRRRIKRGAYL